jgi:hypothetical protein
MQNADELMDLRAERLTLLQMLNSCSNAKRQRINKRLMSVSKRIQRLLGIAMTSSDAKDL